MRKIVIKLLAWTAGFIVLLLAVGWLVLVPSRKEAPYVLSGAWGEAGEGPGQFRDPTGVALAGGEVFVSDARNGRIQVFDREGTFKRAFGDLGRPMNLDIQDGRLVVPEYFNDHVQVYSLEGAAHTTLGGPGEGKGEFRSPGGVALSGEGAVYVAEFMGHRVQKLDGDGEFLRQWGGDTPSRERGGFTYPTDVALTDDGTLYVADGYAHRIQVIAPNSEIENAWGGVFALGIPGPFKGWFNAVSSIALGPEGNIFAVDSYNNRVQKFSPDGEFRTSFGQDVFDHPVAVAVADNGTVFVTDLFNQRVTKWHAPK